MPQSWLASRFAETRPRALAALTRQFRDLDLAEEAFATACERALRVWPEQGLPNDPFAWLLTTGRNAGIDILRRRTRQAGKQPELEAAHHIGTLDMDIPDRDILRDDVLRLLFICCHRDLKTQDQLALALRIVAGMSVGEIARAFLVRPKTMEQRITRAKRTIARADVPFETPGLAERARRLEAVSLMVYLLFNEGWSASSGEVQIRQPLCDEAIRLARLLVQLYPGMAEPMGLLALFLFQNSRKAARVDPDGNLVSLEDQDRRLWDRAEIAQGKALLQKALRHGPAGPFQVQAAIAGVHAEAVSDAETDWAELDRLYAALYRLRPTPVIRLNHAAIVAKTRGPRAALFMLATITSELADYRWFHSARAAFLTELGETALAREAYETALTLGPTEAERHYLHARIAELDAGSPASPK